MNAVDTNVFVYAYDESSPVKRDKARTLIATVADTVLLWQVACEFVSASRKSLPPNTDPAIVWARLSELRAVFQLVLPTAQILDRAAEIQLRSRAQFLDCLIYAACQEVGVTRIYSEDLPGSVVPGLEIINPFK